MKMRGNIGGIAFDFLIAVLIFALLCASLLFAREILFHESEKDLHLTLTTEVIPSEFGDRLAAGDTVYDCLTKRKLGKICKLTRVNSKSGVRFVVEIDATHSPSSNTLRTKALWFRVTDEQKEVLP